MECGRMAMAGLGGRPFTCLSPKHQSPLLFSIAMPKRSRLTITCVGWVSTNPNYFYYYDYYDHHYDDLRLLHCKDPEGILGPPHGGHIARRETELRERLLRQESDRRRAARQGRVVPDTVAGLVEFLLDMKAQEMEYEIARCRPRLNQEFFEHLQVEMGTLRFSPSRTKEMDDRLVELEALHKVLTEGIEAYDKMAGDLVGAKDRLARILASKDKKATLLEMVEKNELDRPLLTLLDENIVAAQNANQDQVALFMEKVRAAVLKYITI